MSRNNTCKKKFRCTDGPFRGQTLWLSADGKTLVFTVRGRTGRYVATASGAAFWEWAQ
jgi:hypothetical protein